MGVSENGELASRAGQIDHDDVGLRSDPPGTVFHAQAYLHPFNTLPYL
jgi:hypothetical protein